MPDHLGDDMRKVKDEKEEPEKEIKCELSTVYFVSTKAKLKYSIKLLQNPSFLLQKIYLQLWMKEILRYWSRM